MEASCGILDPCFASLGFTRPKDYSHLLECSKALNHNFSFGFLNAINNIIKQRQKAYSQYFETHLKPISLLKTYYLWFVLEIESNILFWNKTKTKQQEQEKYILHTSDIFTDVEVIFLNLALPSNAWLIPRFFRMSVIDWAVSMANLGIFTCHLMNSKKFYWPSSILL